MASSITSKKENSKKTGSYRIAQHEQRAIITSTEIKKMHQIFTGDNFVYMCRNLLKNKVLENDLEICTKTKKSNECNPSEVEKQELHTKWLPIAEDALDMILCIGLVPIRFEKNTNSVSAKSTKIPYVPAIGTYDIHIRTMPNGQTHYALYDKQQGMEEVKDAIIFSGFGANPRMDGTLTSIVKNLLPLMDFVAELHDCAISAEKIRSNPPVVVERKETTGSNENREGVDYDYYADSDALKNNLHAQYQRDNVAVTQLQNQKRMFAAQLDGSRNTQNAFNALGNLTPLPHSYKVGTTLAPNSRTDFVSVNKLAQETICAAMGVPRSMMINDSVVRADVEGTHSTFKQTLIYWKKSLTKILTVLYRLVNFEKFGKQMTNITKKKRKFAELESIVNDNLPHITIPVTPYVSSVELKELYLEGIIAWDTYCHYMLRNASLPLSDMASKADPWSKDDKKELLGIKPEKPDATSSSSSSSSSKPSTSKK
tara:strand:- start:10215 stop:11666 length:1452 start_codon:yes stop_codon:yes gene_type:complete